MTQDEAVDRRIDEILSSWPVTTDEQRTRAVAILATPPAVQTLNRVDRAERSRAA